MCAKDKTIILDKNTITASELLKLAGFSSLVYDTYVTKRRKGLRILFRTVEQKYFQ